MTAWLDDGDVRLYHGDALEQLALMPSESVQCIVTSPPFWGLRDYGTPGQIGLEETPDEWCARLVAVMREARRVLRSDGVCWIEVGDTYNAHPGGGGDRNGKSINATQGTGDQPQYVKGHGLGRVKGLKPKDLVGAPWMLAFALRADGWYLRSDTIWARPNPMPESVTDRPTKAHSYVFLLSKSPRYYFDSDAIREAAEYGRSEWSGNVNLHGTASPDARREPHRASPTVKPGDGTGGRNARSVWSIPTEPTPFAHFATFPQALVERCIKAGTSEHGACGECGAPWRRVIGHSGASNADNEIVRKPVDVPGLAKGTSHDRVRHLGGKNYTHIRVPTNDWAQSCDCTKAYRSWSEPAPAVPCVVLDPFMGSGTTALVARRLGRHATGIELNEEYLVIAAKRLQQLSLFADARGDQ